MKPLYAYIGTGVLVFLLCLGFSCPATLLYHWQQGRIEPRIHAYALHGTLWRGNAGLLDLSGIRLSQVEWQLRPHALLLGRLSHRVEASSDTGHLSIVVSRGFGSTRLDDIHGSLPVSQLAFALRLPMPPLAGQADINVSQLRIVGAEVKAAQGQLTLGGLTWPLATPPAELGSYQAEITTEKGIINIVLSDSAGPIELKGKAELAPANKYSFDIRLRPRASAAAEVVNLIQQIGNADSEGWYRLHHEGAF